MFMPYTYIPQTCSEQNFQIHFHNNTANDYNYNYNTKVWLHQLNWAKNM